MKKDLYTVTVKLTKEQLRHAGMVVPTVVWGDPVSEAQGLFFAGCQSVLIQASLPTQAEIIRSHKEYLKTR